jgi:hypothetical protein
MNGAAAFIWVMVGILALAWVLMQTGTVKLGVDFNLWVNLLLVVAVLGAIVNLIVVPILGRTRTSKTTVNTTGTAAAAPTAPAAPAAPGGTVSGAATQEVVQETRDRPTT